MKTDRTHHTAHNSIPISLALDKKDHPSQEPRYANDKRRLLYISLLAVGLGIIISGVAKLLVWLINLVTNVSFFQQFSFAPSSPAQHHLGLWVILLPVAGGIVVGLMALYGSKAIRGHGIPEA